MELGALVAEAVLPSAKLTEVLRGLGDNIVVELEGDALSGTTCDADVKL